MPSFPQFSKSTRESFWLRRPCRRPSSTTSPPTSPGLCTNLQQYPSLCYSAKLVADAPVVNLSSAVSFRKMNWKSLLHRLHVSHKKNCMKPWSQTQSPVGGSGALLSHPDFQISSTQLKGCLKPTFLGTKKISLHSSLIIEVWLNPSILRTAKNK